MSKSPKPESSLQTHAHGPFSTSITGVVFTTILAASGLLVATQFQNPISDVLGPFTNYIPFISTSNIVDVIDHNSQVTYRGSVTENVEHFQNIFYGQDTSGANRFAPPKPFIASPGSVIDATSPGAWCPQAVGDVLPFTSQVTNISENCLSLRIARPRNTKSTSSLPVIAFLHGGGHALGSASEILYTPDGLIQQSVRQGEPVLYVASNYRLGIFGFASTDALMAKKHTNAGTRDQRAALEWVQANIAVFGGDPDRVTIIGNSVGASDIGIHMTSFGGGKKGVPFQQAVLSSGSVNLNFNIKSDQVKERTATAAESVGCGKEDSFGSAAITQCLRDVSFETLTNASVQMMRGARPPFGEHFFHPTVDEDIITDYPSKLVRQGKFVRGIPMIASWNRNDGAWYALPTTASDEEVIGSFTLWMNGLSKASLDKLLYLYPVSDFESMVPPESQPSAQYFRAAQLSRDLWFTCPVVDFTWNYARHAGVENVRVLENNQTRFAPVFKYMGVPFWGVAHLSDLPYIFNTQDLPGGIDSSSAQLDLSKEMSASIIAFANQQVSGTSKHFPADWTPAYIDNNENARRSGHPQQIRVRTFGGPSGSGMATTSRAGRPQGERDAWVAEERLFARCDFINSQEVLKEIGV